MKTTFTIKVSGKYVKNGDRKFPAFTSCINGEWYKVKFTRNCPNAPTTNGVFDVTINIDNCSIGKGEPYTTKAGVSRISNPTIWVHNVIALRQYTDDDFKEQNRAKFAEIFGESNLKTVETDDDLPF